MKKLINLSLEERLQKMDILSNQQSSQLYGGADTNGFTPSPTPPVLPTFNPPTPKWTPPIFTGITVDPGKVAVSGTLYL